MTIHDKGAKVDRDRALLLISYKRMTRAFRTPRKDRLTTAQIAAMPNSQLYQVCKDLYNCAPARKAKRLAGELGLSAPTVSRWAKAKTAIHNARLSVGFFLSRLAAPAKGSTRA